MKLFSWFKKQLFGNELDELQQQKADQIGHRGFWLAWWLLLISLLAQSIAGAPMSQMAAEWVVFMTMCVYGAVEWIRNGIWTIADSRPSLRKNLVWSATAAVAFFYLPAGPQQPPELVGTRRLVGRCGGRCGHRAALPGHAAAWFPALLQAPPHPRQPRGRHPG